MPGDGQIVRFKALDGWRGIAALAVAAYHLMLMSHVFQWPIARHAFLFVDFFFVLSGFVIAHAYHDRIATARDSAAFLVRRFGRVWPLHIVMLGAFVAIELAKLAAVQMKPSLALRAFDPAGPNPLATLPENVLLLHGLGVSSGLTWNFPSWSISAELGAYVVLAAAFVLAGGWRTPVIASLAFAAADVLISTSTRGMDVTYDLGFARCLFGFTAGFLTYEIWFRNAARTSGMSWPWPASSTASAVLEWALVAAMLLFVHVAGFTAIGFAAPLVFALAVYVFAFETGPVSRLLRAAPVQLLGRWSCAIYMVHALFATIIMMLASAYERASGAHFWRPIVEGGVEKRVFDPGAPFLMDLVLAGYLILVVMVARTVHEWIERPGIAWFNRLSRNLSELPRRTISNTAHP